MKIKNDFVTNSSSTSYLLSLKDSFSKESFLKAIGVEQESLLRDMLCKLYDAIESNKRDILDVIKDPSEPYESVEKLLISCGYEQETINTITRLIKNGRTVYYGKLHSDGFSAIEAFFCTESFLCCDDELYFNGNIGGW